MLKSKRGVEALALQSNAKILISNICVLVVLLPILAGVILSYVMV